MTGPEFALSVLNSFDLDMARHCIFKNQYLSLWGGIDTVRAFFNNSELSKLDMEALVWSDRGWRGLSEGEKHLKRMETKERVWRYVQRINYNHPNFSHFPEPIEELSEKEFNDVKFPDKLYIGTPGHQGYLLDHTMIKDIAKCGKYQNGIDSTFGYWDLMENPDGRRCKIPRNQFAMRMKDEAAVMAEDERIAIDGK